MKTVRTGGLALLLIGFFTGTCSAQAPFRAPEVASVTDAYVPYQYLLDGFFVLDASVDTNGSVTRVELLRNPGALDQAAESAVRSWKFRPAEENGNPVPSEMIAVVVYRPPVAVPVQPALPKDFKPILPRPRDHGSGDLVYSPPGIVSVVYPVYPANAVGWGSVVIQATLKPSGEVEKTQVLLGKPPFTRLALAALGQWQFQAASLRGKPVRSKIAVAFVFQMPTS